PVPITDAVRDLIRKTTADRPAEADRSADARPAEPGAPDGSATHAASAAPAASAMPTESAAPESAAAAAASAPPPASAAPPDRSFTADGVDWVARVVGAGVVGKGVPATGTIVAVRFHRADEPHRPLREALLPRGRFEYLDDDELAAL